MEIIDENRVREIVKDELANFTPQKKKRAPNKWQIFLKSCTREEQNKELPYTERVKVCSIKYKESKNLNANGLSSEQSTQSEQSTWRINWITKIFPSPNPGLIDNHKYPSFGQLSKVVSNI